MTQAQKNYEKFLGIGTMILMLWHMLMTFGKYFCSTYKAEMIYATVLALAAVIYLVLCHFKWPETQYRIKDFAKKFRSPWQILCFILFIWTILSFLVNGMPYFMDNLWLIFDVGIDCLLLFNLPMVLSKEMAKKTIDVLLHIVSLAGTGIALFGLWHLFTLDFITLPTGEIIGMVRHSFQLGSYYNLTAAIALSFILISLYMIAAQSKALKIIYALNLIPHTIILMLTNSRTAFITCIFAYFIAMFLVVWNIPAQKSIPVRLVTSLAASAAAAGITWMMRTWSFQLFESVTHFSNPVTSRIMDPAMLSDISSGSDEVSRCLLLVSLPVFLSEEKMKQFFLKIRRVFSRTAKISMIAAVLMVLCTVCSYVAPMIDNGTRSFQLNIARAEGEAKTAAQAGQDALRDLDDLGTIKAREQIWQKTISVIQTDWRSFLFGITPIATKDALAQYRVTHAHNQVLQVGLILGVPMMVVFILLLIVMIVKSFRLGLISGKRHFPGAYILPVVFGTYVILTLVEAYLVATFSIMSSLFFLFCGWINALDTTNSVSEENPGTIRTDSVS